MQRQQLQRSEGPAGPTRLGGAGPCSLPSPAAEMRPGGTCSHHTNSSVHVCVRVRARGVRVRLGLSQTGEQVNLRLPDTWNKITIP